MLFAKYTILIIIHTSVKECIWLKEGVIPCSGLGNSGHTKKPRYSNVCSTLVITVDKLEMQTATEKNLTESQRNLYSLCTDKLMKVQSVISVGIVGTNFPFIISAVELNNRLVHSNE